MQIICMSCFINEGFFKKMLRAWHTIVDKGVDDYSCDDDDHDEHGNGRNGMEIGVKREDPMSQESQGESPSSSKLTSCTSKTKALWVTFHRFLMVNCIILMS
ncbi:hypothetical protein GOP47_0022153 [Adiantum capillus-veneris]|uniref:Uncharacterized protein n=1 Tax=Adiantum capillus-veneris TaxID=13818 RepID=A0A9D4U8S9_ADICA|nr:hypothetical protein GOP47_0022153 [Adiantum capillus-veneris]